MRHYFLGMASNYRGGKWFSHLFTVGRKQDYEELTNYLGKKYGGDAVLCKNGRSALALALKAFFKPGDAVLVNGFTCYAVYEAVRAAGLKPIFVDISKEDFNFDFNALVNTISDGSRHAPSRPSLRGSGAQSAPVVADGLEPSENRVNIKGIIIQNTFGNSIDMVKMERLAKKCGLTIIEDLAHCAGRKYPDGREVGTVGAACALSFGKDKVIDTVSGGAVVFRGELLSNFGARPTGPSPRAVGARPRAAALRIPSVLTKASPSKPPRPSDHLRARFYPMFGALCRTLSYVHLGGALMRGLIKIHWVERSADNKLNLERRMSKFEARLALKQMKNLPKGPVRNAYLVNSRDEVLKKLRRAGFYFDSFWYEKPISPIRYYQKVDFPEEECPNAVFIAKHIINFPNNYPKKKLLKARGIIHEYMIGGEQDG